MKNYYIRINTSEQLKAVSRHSAGNLLIVPCILWKAAKEMFKGKNTRLYLALPDVAREKDISRIAGYIADAKDAEGIMAYNADELGMLKESAYPGRVLLDSQLYVYNNEAARLYMELFPDVGFLSSDELTDEELNDLDKDIKRKMIYKAYGRPKLMVTAQCLKKNYKGCNRKRGEVFCFRDNVGRRQLSVSECSWCYNVIYDDKPVFMPEVFRKDEWNDLFFDFTTEDGETVIKVLKDALTMDDPKNSFNESLYQRGHHFRGID